MKRKATGLLLLLALALAPLAGADSADVTRRDLSKTVFGAGSVMPVSQPGVYAEIDGRVSGILVGVGDSVQAGDVLAHLKNDELAAEIAQLEYDIQIAQKEMLYTKTHTQYSYKPVLDRDGNPRDDVNTGEPLMQKYSTEITVRAPCDGRIMAVYIEEGSDALAAYREHGAVVMLSTDGRMKVELEAIEHVRLDYEDTVVIIGEDIYTTGKVIELSRYGTEAMAVIESDDYPLGAPVSVYTQDGTLLGETTLEINKPMAISAYGGTIKGLAWNVEVGNYLKAYDVVARIDWDETPLYYDNDVVLRDYVKVREQLDAAMKKNNDLTLVAPCDGVIASVDVEKDDEVTDGTKLLSLVETGEGLKIMMSVDELDIIHVEKGQIVTASVDALPEVTLTGVVDKIAPLGHTDTSVTTYDVYVTLTGEVDSRVRGGMNVSGDILVGSKKDVLTIPTDALRRDGAGWYVTLESGQEASVEIGMMTDDLTEITAGLYEGETIVY